MAITGERNCCAYCFSTITKPFESEAWVVRRKNPRTEEIEPHVRRPAKTFWLCPKHEHLVPSEKPPKDPRKKKAKDTDQLSLVPEEEHGYKPQSPLHL